MASLLRSHKIMHHKIMMTAVELASTPCLYDFVLHDLVSGIGSL
jgi:hypothetical protein